MGSAFIGDGYDLKGKIDAVQGRFEEVNIVFRAIGFDEHTKIMNHWSILDADEVIARIQKTCKDNLVSWDLCYPKRKGSKVKKVVPITNGNLLKVHPKVLDEIFSYICGTSPSTPDFDEEENTTEEDDQKN